MKKTTIIFSIVMYLFVTLIPWSVNAQDQNLENKNDNEEVTETETANSETSVEEVFINEGTSEEVVNDIIEVSLNEVVNTEVQATTKNARTITYPATIASIFPDAKLAQGIASKLSKQVTSTVTKADLNTIRFINNGDMSQAVTNLAGIDELSELTALNISMHNVTDYSNVDWSKMPKLTHLNLAGNYLTDLTTIDWSKFVGLESLDLNTNALNDEDMRAIDWGSLSSLKRLMLYNNFISDLTSIDWAKMPQLQQIDLIGQRHILPDVDYSNPLVVENPILNQLGTNAPVISASEGGTYDAATNKITWNLTSTDETFLTFVWREDLTINGVSVTFAGRGMFSVREAYRVVFKDWDGSILKDENLSAGSPITQPETPPRTGFIFTGWTPTVAAVMPANNVEYTANYTEITNADYSVEYYQEELDGSFGLLETVTHQGLTAELVEAIIKTYTGFTHDPANTSNLLTGTIAEDGSLVLKVYYTRNQQTVTYKDDDGSIIEVITGKYGARYTEPADPTKAAHVFSHWNEVTRIGFLLPNQRAVEKVIPHYDAVYIAHYIPNVVTPTEKPTTDDGGPFTTDACGVITDRWGNVMFKPTTCQLSTGYQVPNTGVK